MKKLLILSLIAFFALGSANVFAQGTGKLPQIGSTHDYFVNANADGSSQTSGSGDTYTWWISTTPTNLLMADNSTDYTVTGGAAYNSGAVDAYKISIKWNPASAGKTYYLVVQETGAAPNECSNLKAIPIQPSNDFQLAFTNVGPDGSGNLSSQSGAVEYCAPDMSLTATGTTINYGYGKSQIIYELNPSGIQKDWNFTYKITEDASTNGSSVTAQIATGTLTNIFTAGTVITPDYTVDNNEHTQNVSVYNEPVYLVITVTNNANEGTTAQNFSVVVRDVNDGTNLATKINTTTVNDENTTETKAQTVNNRPTVNGINFN